MSKKVLFVFVFAITACEKGFDEAGSKAFETKPECEQTAVAHKYTARWKTGEYTTVTASDRDDLIENFVKPNLEDLDFVEQDQKITIERPIESSVLTPSDANTEWGQAKISARYAWDHGISGQGIIVAVVDSGVDVAHSLLQDNIFINQTERAGISGVDDDHNGFVDDVNGWNFVDNQPSNNDELGHGTHVAGVIASRHDNAKAIGVAPDAKILPIDFINNDGGTTGDAIRSLQYAARMGAKIINASWGGSICSNSLRAAVQDLANSDILFISAAGNSGRNISYSPEYPAAFDLPKQLTIGASRVNNYLAGFSNFGQLVDLVAPGEDVYSTYLLNGYRSMSGTSMATPFVSGVAALLWSSKPNASATEIKNSIMGGVVQGFFNVQTRGQLNVPNSLSILN